MINKTDIQNIINETKENLNDKKDFEYNIKFYYGKYLIRISRWFDLFNKHNNKLHYNYDKIINSIFDNQLLFEQTFDEFKLSEYFFESLFKQVDDIHNSDDCFNILLNISLIFSKFPGLQQKPLKQAFAHITSSCDKLRVLKVFNDIFVKYENPRIITNNLKYLSWKDIDILMFVLQGNNIRKHQQLNISISKKETYNLIYKINYNIILKDNITLRSVLTSKLIINTSDNRILYDFLKYNHSFNNQINIFAKRIDIWKRIFLFLSEINWDISEISLQEYIDYFENIFSENKQINIKKLTQRSIEQKIITWHYNVDYTSTKYVEWKLKPEKDILLYNNIEYYFDEITNSRELYKEGYKMKHCVFSYLKTCNNSYSSIWSIKKGRTKKHYLTIEVVSNNIIQIQGKTNKLPQDYDINIIKKWANLKQYNIYNY